MNIAYNKVFLENSFAKINLFLEVGKKRPDGYHDVTNIMQNVSLCDKVSLLLSEGDGIEVVCTNMPELSGESNLAYKAAETFLKNIGAKANVKIKIEKNIPVCAGLGGGSANCASVLKLINKAFGEPLSLTELEKIGLTLGADVPFCIHGGCVFAKGIGEKFTEIEPFKNICVLIIKDGEKKSTKQAYLDLDGIENRQNVSEEKIINAIKNKDIYALSKNLYNAFSLAVPISENVKTVLNSSPCIGYSLCGAGPGVIAIFENKQDAEATSNKFKNMNIFSYVSLTL